MHVNEAIKLRRSIKQYDPKHVMTKEEIHALLSNAVLSPTAFNIQNWRFVVVTDKALRQKIREVSGCVGLNTMWQSLSLGDRHSSQQSSGIHGKLPV